MRFCLCLFFVMMSFNLHAQTDYSITIDGNGYLMKMQMAFPKAVSLKSVRRTFRNGFILSQLSPNVKSVVNTPGEASQYESLMTVKSFGIKSMLLSQCSENTGDSFWSRKCILSAKEKDGGKYMEWKEDFVECKLSENVTCHFEIKGKAKPVTILGVQVMSDKLFSVKAKYSALNNFFKQYFFIKNYNSSVQMALKQFEKSSIKKELEAFNDEATSALKSSASYKRSYTLDNE